MGNLFFHAVKGRDMQEFVTSGHMEFIGSDQTLQLSNYEFVMQQCAAGNMQHCPVIGCRRGGLRRAPHSTNNRPICYH